MRRHTEVPFGPLTCTPQRTSTRRIATSDRLTSRVVAPAFKWIALAALAFLTTQGIDLAGRRLSAAEPEASEAPNSTPAPNAGKEPSAGKKKPTEEDADWKPLFDGKSLGGWKATEFGGQGDVTVEEGQILLDFGSSMTGVTWTKDFPTSNYEIQLEAMRVDGIDFFCGLTFPVKKSYCSLIVGGWGGAVVGLSSIDGKDASENDTTQYMKFDKGRWYAIRLRVTDDRISVWLDDKQVVDQDIRGKKISTRNEVDRSRPLGFSTWETKAALRKIAYRPLKP
jgi:hypothetical protein